MGVSVYREPVDVNAVLFEVGQPDPEAEHVPDRKAADRQIIEILGAAGIVIDDSFDPANVPADIQAKLVPHIAELNRPPTPPFRPPLSIQDQIMACQAASLLTVSGNDGKVRYFVHRWTATELAVRSAESGPGLSGAHQQAAAYWRWRFEVWLQNRVADVHDLLEARHHLLQAGEPERAGEVTEMACSELHKWGAWDQEAALIHDTLARLSADSPRRAVWIHQLGIVAQERGDYDEASRQYQRALDINQRLGNQASTARGYHQLGVLAHLRGDYDEASRQYQRALDIKERLGDQADPASDYHQLGMLAHLRGDYDEAARQYQRALDINQRLGNQADSASGYHQLGVLAHDREDYDEAARQYQRALDIKERLGDQGGLAITYSQLGILKTDRGESTAIAIAWHVKALMIRLHLGVPQARIDLDRLSASRRELGVGPFTSLLAEAGGDPELVETVTSWLDQWDNADDSPA
jgi:tetratricopeptide (TPR) repeat protein